MAKKISRPAEKQKQPQPTAQSSFQIQLQGLLKRHQYRQALEEIKKVRRTDPEVKFKPSEAEIWLLRGEQEFEKNELKQAEVSLQQAISLGLKGEVYYWLARCLLGLKRLDAALDLIRKAFEADSLTKDYAICYLKLLLLKGETTQVEQLISKQAKRFTAAQLYWTRGVLDLKSEQPDLALASFQKLKRPSTPSDSPTAWIAYTQQTLGDWEAAGRLLGLAMPTNPLMGFPFSLSPFLKEPILQRLATFQKAKTGEPPLNLSDLKQGEPKHEEAITALSIVQLIEKADYHNAAHALLKLKTRSTLFPELATLRPIVLTLAGQQAMEDGEPECTEEFWKLVLSEQPFNPQLAVNQLMALELNASYKERQHLLTRLVKWVEQDAKKNPQNWQGDRRPLTLAHLHCYLADTWLELDRYRTALGSLQQAERICPTSPEVIGRKGLLISDENYSEAAQLMTQALEGGCEHQEVYDQLLACWDELDDPQAKLEARRRFGQRFGDLNPEAEVRFEPWADALYTQNYTFFSKLVQSAEKVDPPLQACRIFMEAVQGFPNAGGRVSLNQAQAQAQWDTLLEGLPGQQQIPTLQAIALSLHLFSKREKGIAAFLSQYMQRLIDLSAEHLDARFTYLVVLAVKETTDKKLELPIEFYLNRVTEPGNTLARIQLQVRRFNQSTVLRSRIDQFLTREPQNPLLLLAKATTYPPNSSTYEELKQQGFDLARRLQDAKALQAFREEQAFLDLRRLQSIMPSPAALENFDEGDMVNFFEDLVRTMFGNKVPKSELDRMMPELQERLLNSLPEFEEEEEEEDFSPFPNFFKPKKRKGFRDL